MVHNTTCMSRDKAAVFLWIQLSILAQQPLLCKQNNHIHPRDSAQIWPFQSHPFHLGPFVVPVDRYGFMITRELLASKPQFEPQISRRYNHPDIKLTDVEGDAAGPASSSLVDFDKLILLDSFQIAFHFTKLIRSICKTCQPGIHYVLDVVGVGYQPCFMLLGNCDGSWWETTI